MTEPIQPRASYPPVDPHGELARKNVLLGWALFGLVLVIFAGSIGVALVYLALD
jgi:hypothetical protein